MKKKKICENCKNKFSAMSHYQRYCNNCHHHALVKGGENMADKKEKTEKVDLSKKREDDAKKLIDFMKNDLKLEEKDLTKVISRAYKLIKK